MKISKGFLTGSLLAGLLVASTACGGATKDSAPEPTPDNIVQGTKTQVIQMPEGFRNVAVTCYGPNGIYVTSRGAFQTGNAEARALPSSIAVVANDPLCSTTPPKF